MMKRLVYFHLMMSMMVTGLILTVATPGASGEIPPELIRWRSWVLHGEEEALCPSAYNDGAVVRCRWPSRLSVDVNDDGGRFEQHWSIFARGWVSLPGSMDMWPDGVVVDGNSLAVVNRDNHPTVRLSPGEHHIKGRFYWSRMPEMMRIPPSMGLISLTVGGRKIESPVIDTQGRLWLLRQEAHAGREDDLKVRVFRLIDDGIPMQITTLLRLDVSGRAREIHLENVLVNRLVPMKLTSQLPVRLTSDSGLSIQARPGRWEVQLVGRMREPVVKIDIGKASHGDEVWSFRPRHHLRMVEIEGVPQVEPRQTDLPAEWRQYAAYLVKPDASMKFKEVRRGDPDPVPDQLSLFRRWWLDFDGKGFTLHDSIDGTLSRQWYLAMNSPFNLGRVSVDGKDQVITAQGVASQAGVELRRGALKLQSDARMTQRSGAINAVGWDHDFKNVSGELHLPPGWRLIAAMGVDQVSDTWLQRWSLLDFFLVLLIALAVFKLRGWKWGVLALATMVLLFHEHGAPRLVWLHILAALALLPLLPDNWIKRVVSIWGAGAVVVLLFFSIPFVVNQIRWGFYPQLAPHNDYQVTSRDRIAEAEPPQPERAALKSTPFKRKAAGINRIYVSNESAAMPNESKTKAPGAIRHQDPDALIPTGPGLPEWHWQKVRLNWNGPVAKDQTMRLFLLSPIVNFGFTLLRVILLSLFIWGVIDWRPWWLKIRDHLNSGKATVAAAVLCLSVIFYWPPVHAADGEMGFPPPKMLEQLKERLLEPPDCLPFCADISRLEVAVSDDELQVMLKVHAAEQTAVPLPVNRKSWTPGQIMLDNAPISGLARDESGVLWAVVPPGMHTVVMLGNLEQEGMVQIPLPLKPHLASYVAKGWSVKGILPDGTVGSSIQLTRIQGKPSNRSAVRDQEGAIPPFLRVRRELHLGLTWQVSTTVERMTPIGTPIVVNLPLLADESLTTAGLHVDQNHVLINMSAEQRSLSFASTLKFAPIIQLTAPRAVPWTETWVLDASPIWHCGLEGIAVVHHQDGSGQWQPQWQPWPGESVSIKVHRPKAVDGQAVTLQRADLTVIPGRRFSRGELAIKINTSRGGQHTIELPDQTNLQKVRVNAKSLPIRQDGKWVTIPLQPGLQTIDIQWHQLTPFKTLLKAPELKIGQAAVNANITFKMPQKRWILLVGGPQWGPAVLFWSYLAVILLGALGLGRLNITSLKKWQWFLLGLGLTQIPVAMALIIVGWLLGLGLRQKRAMPDNWFVFNMLQLGMILLTFLALISLFTAVKAGLVGHPDMQIDGNHSSSWTLNWTQDRIDNRFPQPWVLSLPIWCYRGLMLAWSLWLAYALLGWLKWGWQCYTQGGVWKKAPSRKKKAAELTAKPQAE